MNYGQRVIHPHQTTKQPVVWICQNPECGTHKGRFEFASDEPTCPKCAVDGYPYVQKKVLIHFLMRHKEGMIQGQTGRFNLACDPKRENIATLTNGEAATGEPRAVNCPGCLKVIREKGLEFSGQPLPMVGAEPAL